MRHLIPAFALVGAVGLTGLAAQNVGPAIQLGPRPFFLVNDMADSPLKQELVACFNGPFRRSRFSIGHRGAALQFPEHTRQSYEAAARMGAGIVECDVTFTKDKQLVCRHAQNDLAATTNILVTSLAATCVKPFRPATFGLNGEVVTPASAECRTSELTLDEFKSLTGKMDGVNPAARTPAEFLAGTPRYRTDLYSGPGSGTLLSHRESIDLLKELGVMMTPELKSPSVRMPFDGFTEDQFAQKLIDEYRKADVPPGDVWPQSFRQRDVLYWIDKEPDFGKQAVLLEDAQPPAALPTLDMLEGYKRRGINIVAPRIPALIELDAGNMVPSQYAKHARAAGLDIIAWTLERGPIRADGDSRLFSQTSDRDRADLRDGDLMRVIDVLAQQVGVIGIFSDWPATVSFYASCKGLK